MTTESQSATHPYKTPTKVLLDQLFPSSKHFFQQVATNPHNPATTPERHNPDNQLAISLHFFQNKLTTQIYPDLPPNKLEEKINQHLQTAHTVINQVHQLFGPPPDGDHGPPIPHPDRPDQKPTHPSLTKTADLTICLLLEQLLLGNNHLEDSLLTAFNNDTQSMDLNLSHPEGHHWTEFPRNRRPLFEQEIICRLLIHSLGQAPLPQITNPTLAACYTGHSPDHFQSYAQQYRFLQRINHILTVIKEYVGDSVTPQGLQPGKSDYLIAQANQQIQSILQDIDPNLPEIDKPVYLTADICEGTLTITAHPIPNPYTNPSIPD